MKHDSSQVNDKSLARLSANGDRAAFDELVQRYCRPLANFAASRTATFQDAEDITQETFLRAYQKLSSYDAKYPLKSWLFTIAYRLIISSYRKKRTIRLSEDVAKNIEARPTMDKSGNNWLWQSIQDMTPENRMVLWMRYKQDMTISDIAQITGKSEISIRVRLHRARLRLGKLLNRHPDKPKHWQLRNAVCMKGTD